MLPDAEECTNTHHARSKNSTFRLLQFMADQWSAQAGSTRALGRFPTKDRIKSIDASRKCRFPSDGVRHHASLWPSKTSSGFMYVKWVYCILVIICNYSLCSNFTNTSTCSTLEQHASIPETSFPVHSFNPSSIPACQEYWDHPHPHDESHVYRDDILQSCDREIGSSVAD